MFEPERLESILSYLREKQTATVDTLARRMFISAATVRRDLNLLEKRGLVKRVHGGAVLLDGANRELPLSLREQQNVEAKRLIASRASRYLRDGQVIFLDASSTVMALCRHFEGVRDLTIITNGLKTAQDLTGLPHKIYCTGGMLLHNSNAYVGDYAIECVRHFNADVFFFSSRGVSDAGLITDASPEEVAVRRAMYEQSRTRIFLCDQSKFGQTYCYNLCTTAQADAFITDSAE